MESRVGGPGQRIGLRGRAEECARLDRLIEDVRRGNSRSLVLRGEPGIGKTVLLEYLAESASGLRVVRALGVESEMELAYASLHQLCAPLLDRLGGLPAPQRQAMEIAFGLQLGHRPGPVSRQFGRAELALGGGRGASAAVRGRRCAVAGSGLGADVGICGSSPVGGAGRHRVRRTRVERGARSACPSWRCGACRMATPARCCGSMRRLRVR